MAEPLALEVILEDPAWAQALPQVEARAAAILQAAALAEGAAGELCVLLTGSAAMRALNARWRGADYPTNVLAFPAVAGAGLGELALGLGVLAEEAQAQGKPLADHFAHLLVHGLLHLLGYDHEAEAEALRMEARERALLKALGISDPYLERQGA